MERKSNLHMLCDGRMALKNILAVLGLVCLAFKKKIHFWEHGSKKEEASITQAKPHIHILSCVFLHILPRHQLTAYQGDFKEL